MRHFVPGKVTVSAVIVLGTIILSGCKKEEQPPIHQTVVVISDTIMDPANSVADASGNIYSTIDIGSQRWMGENLRTSHFSNGDPIAYVPDNGQWESMSTGAWCYYNNDAAYGELYAKLYNWSTVTDTRNVCPAGWHVPTDQEWMELEQSLGVPVADLSNTGPRGAAANVGGQLKSMLLWDPPNTGANNSSGFLGFPAGSRGIAGNFFNIGSRGHWWSASEMDSVQAWYRQLWWNNASIYRLGTHKGSGGSIRCVED